MTNDITARLKTAVQNRDNMASKIDRLKGRLQEAEQSLAAVEKECRDKNIDPDKIDEALEKLQSHYNDKVTELESKLNAVQTALEPFDN